MRPIGRVVLTIVAVLSLALSVGCTRIGPGHVGIVVQAAGSNKGVLNTPVRTGRVWYNPFSETVIEYPTYMQTAKWTKDPNEGKPVDESITFTNKGKMVINADISLSYLLHEEKVPAFYVTFKSDELDTFTHGFLRNVARDCFNEHAGKYDIDQIMGDNATFLNDAKKCTQDQVAEYGVELKQFGFIGAPRPPQNVIDSINNSASAQQAAIQKQNELAQVQADANKKAAEADGEKRAMITRAEGEAEANRIKANSITDNLLRSRALDNEHDRIWKWNGQMPSTILGSDAKTLVTLPQTK